MDQTFRRFDPGQPADLVQYGVQNLRVRGGDLQQQIKAAGGGENPLDFRQGFEPLQDRGLGARLDGQQNRGAQAALADGFAQL